MVGIGFILYPTYSKKKTEKKQTKLMEELQKKIEQNKENKDNESNDNVDKDNADNSDSKKDTYDPETVKKEVKRLEIEENENVVEQNVSDELLKKQKVIGMIEIPAINICFPIVEGSNRANIAVAIGHMRGTSPLGGEGNCVLAGHHGGIYGKFFKDLELLQINDKVILTDDHGKVYTYNVDESFKVKPTDVYVTDNLEGYKLTLITCQDDGKSRLVVRCSLG